MTTFLVFLAKLKGDLQDKQWIEQLAFYHSNMGIFQGFLAFQKKILFQNTKRSQNVYFSHFWFINISLLISNLFQNQFPTLGSGQIEHAGTWSNWRTRTFSVWPLPKVKNLFRKQIWNKKAHIFILNIFTESAHWVDLV